MTHRQRLFIAEIMQQRLRPDYHGSAWPIADDPLGEVKTEMKNLAKKTGMQFCETENFLFVFNRNTHACLN